MSETAPVIEIRDLHKSYGDLEVLKGVSMTAPRGHVISLIGSSGSGKSTLLRAVNGLTPIARGEILVAMDDTLTSYVNPQFDQRPTTAR